MGFWIGITIRLIGVEREVLHLSFKGPGAAWLRKGLPVALAVSGATVGLDNVLYVQPGDWKTVIPVDELHAAVKKAEDHGKPVMIDFSTSLCGPCGEMERDTFHDERVVLILTRKFALVKIDVRNPTDDQMKMQDGFASLELPSVLIYPPDAKLSEELDALRDGEAMPAAAVHLRTFVDADEFLAAIEPVRQ